MTTATRTLVLCQCGVPVFQGDNDTCDSCARKHLAGALRALRLFVDANLPDDGSDDRKVESWFRKPLRLGREAIARAEGSAD